MEKLTDESWTAESGDADGKHVLCYAYGPAFAKYEKGQVGAWKYNEETSMIEFWYSKSHCPGMCTSCCNKNKGNEPHSVLNKKLNPSANQNAIMTYELVNKFQDLGSHLCLRHQQCHSQVSVVEADRGLPPATASRMEPEGMKSDAQKRVSRQRRFDLGESWLARRVEKRPYQIAPRPVRLLRRLSREEDGHGAGQNRLRSPFLQS
ncbi:unnamed protein product [Symbiodinium sp. KB8]|nr:unnamed protein product [Symbiodinium sp. KB8]